MKSNHLANVIAIALACATISARADTSPDDVIVTATRSARALTDVPASVSLVTATDIEDTPSQSLDDVLRHVPGVNLPGQTGIQIHPTADNVSMRGLGGIHALVMVDGVPINDPFFGTIQWGRIPLEGIDHVEIVRGGGSPLWGNFAMGGVINVITRAPESDVAIADAGGGGFGTYRSSLYGSYGLSATNRVSVTAALNGTDGFMSVPIYARRPFDTPTSFAARNLELRDTWQALDDVLVDLRFNYHKNNQQLGTPLDTNRQDTSSYVANIKKSFGDAGSLTGTVFHSDSTFVTDNPIVTDSTLPLASQTEHIDNIHTTPFHNTGGSLVGSQNFRGLLRNLTAGVDVNDVKGSDSAAIFDATGVNQIRTDVGRGEQLFAGAFIQTSLLPAPRLEFLASGRIQYFEVLNGFDGNPGGAGNEPNQSTTKFDPRISVRYGFDNGFALRGAYYQAFRAPTLDNLYRGFASDGGIFYPNSRLKPETLQGGEVGVDFVADGLRTQVTVYRTEVSNLITSASLANSELPPGFFFGSRLVNAATAQAQGVEAEVNWKIGGGFSTTLGYTWADSVYKSNPTDPLSVGQQLTDVPRNTASAALTYQNSQGWRVSTDALWVSATSWANADHTNPGFPYQAAADPHFVMDVAATYPVRESLEIYLQVQNLLDRHYIVNPGPFNPPEYGTPFLAFVGVRVTLK
ncbi:MAG: TonB-dependent receptor [Steroidobacteraceae bacterium]